MDIMGTLSAKAGILKRLSIHRFLDETIGRSALLGGQLKSEEGYGTDLMHVTLSKSKLNILMNRKRSIAR